MGKTKHQRMFGRDHMIGRFPRGENTALISKVDRVESDHSVGSERGKEGDEKEEPYCCTGTGSKVPVLVRVLFLYLSAGNISEKVVKLGGLKGMVLSCALVPSST